MATDLSIEERYIQHQRGLFVGVPRPAAPVSYVNCVRSPPPQHYQATRAPERPDQNLHSAVQNLQKQVNELQHLFHSLAQQVSRSTPTEPIMTHQPEVARTPSEEALLRLHRQRRQQCNERAEQLHREAQQPHREAQQPHREPEAVETSEAREASLPETSRTAAAARELSEPRRQAKRSWIQGLSKGPSLWQVLQQRLCKEQKEEPGGKKKETGTDTKAVNEEATPNMPMDELCKYICSDLQNRFGCLEVAAVHAALSMRMCSEQEIDSYLSTAEDGERGVRSTLAAAAKALPPIAFGAQAFEDALLDVLQVRISRKSARRLFRQLASLPTSTAPIGSSGTTAQLTQLSNVKLEESQPVSPPRRSAWTQPEKGLSRSRSEGRTTVKVARPEARTETAAAKRPAGGVHLQEQIRQRWQHGLREKSESPEGSKVSSRRSSLKASPPPSKQASTNPLPPNVDRRSYEVWRRDVSLKSLLAFEAEVKARQESSTTSSENEAVRDRELPASSRSSKLPSSDSPPSSLRLRRSSEELCVEALPACPAPLLGLPSQVQTTES
ncbi:unnamed protein product [Durusdinium trenchii]|uniref:Uncharacterized protein n=1 Tax=Durusdinium trenchii TaxID=1381693 RepID=A0ABP0MJP3_9DINO